MDNEREFADPKLDIVFKKIFGDVKNSDLLIDFLCAVLEIPQNEIIGIEIVDNEIVPDLLNKKFSRLDLLLKLEDKNINIEIQVNNYGNFPERTLYYWSKIFSGQLNKNEDYNQLKQTISINIIDFNLFKFKKSHSTFGVYEHEEHTQLTDKFRIDFLELKKAKRYKTNTHLQEWLEFLNVSDEEELNMIEKTTTNPNIKNKAVVVVREMSADEKFLMEIRQRKKADLDERSALNFAKNEGIQQGIQKERENTIAILKKLGHTDEEIKKLLD